MRSSSPQSDYDGSAPDEQRPDYLEEDDGVSLRDAWLLVRERKWYVLTVFLVTVLLAAVYTFLSTPIYQSQATVQVLRHGPQIMRVADGRLAHWRHDVDLTEITSVCHRRTAAGLEFAVIECLPLKSGEKKDVLNSGHDVREVPDLRACRDTEPISRAEEECGHRPRRHGAINADLQQRAPQQRDRRCNTWSSW